MKTSSSSSLLITKLYFCNKDDSFNNPILSLLPDLQCNQITIKSKCIKNCPRVILSFTKAERFLIFKY